MDTRPKHNDQKHTSNFMLDAGLLAVAVFWGASYPVTKVLLEAGLGTDELMAMRFGVSIVPLLVRCAGRLGQFTRREVVDGVLFSLVLWLTIALEVLGALICGKVMETSPQT